ncbi:MAG: hypothetical protein SYC29_01655 [Planctomycetota bacterium]|nr:hypothetical protein [Planctomycetota bacterium]
MTPRRFSLILLSVCLASGAAAWAQMPPPPGGVELPPGHPEVPGMPTEPTEAPAAAGRLAVQAIQGTPGGPAIGEAPVTVQLIHRGMLLDTLSAALDEHGVVMFEDLAVNMSVQPVVEIDYAGVTYRQVGSIMDANNAEQKIQVHCYEVTEEEPDWNVAMRHLMLSPEEQAVRVTELLVLQHAGDRSWVGEPTEDGARVVMELALPEGAYDVQLGGGFSLDGSDAGIEGGALMIRRPLVPGRSEMRLSYVVPAPQGLATIDILAPADVQRTMVIVPEEMTTEAVRSLRDGGTQAMGEKTVRFYVATDLPSGERASLSVGGLGSGPVPVEEEAAVAANAPSPSSGGAAKLIAAIGGGVLLLLAAVIIFFRSSPRPAAD